MLNFKFAGVILSTLYGSTVALPAHWMSLVNSRALVAARMDPIVTPGNVSPHMHIVTGANNFAADSTYDTLRTAQCTNVPLGTDDLSTYWTPGLYRVFPNGSFGFLNPIKCNIYYSFQTASGTTMEAFPNNFSMLVGSPSAQNRGCNGGTPTNPACNNAKTWIACGQNDATHKVTMPTTSCSSIGLHMYFPSCWDGQSFTPANQDQHLVYATGTGACPTGFSHKLPELVYDWWFDTSTVTPNSNGPTYILSNGETSGYGLHGDFMNGWNATVLQNIINQCGPTTSPDSCPLVQTLARPGKSSATSCKFQGNLPSEDVGVTGNPLSTLPGCHVPFDSTKGSPSSVGCCEPALAAPVGVDSGNGLPVAAPKTCSSPSVSGGSGSSSGSGSTSGGVQTTIPLSSCAARDGLWLRYKS